MNEPSPLYMQSTLEEIQAARQFPRDLVRCRDQLRTMVSMSPEIAEECLYARPVWDSDKGANVDLVGPSVRLAELAVSAWRNVRAGARVARTEERVVVAEAVVHDLEANVAVQTECVRSIWSAKKNKRFSDSVIVSTANAACSIAFRNAVFKVVPRALIQDVFRTAQEVALGDPNELPGKVARMFKAFEGLGVGADEVLKHIGRKRGPEIDREDLATLLGVFQSIQQGEATVAEVFRQSNEPRLADLPEME